MILLWSVLAAFSSFQDDPAKASAILESISRRYENVFRISFELEWWSQGNKKETRKSKVTLQRPNLARMESRVGDEEWLEVYDGKTLWTYEKPVNEYRRREEPKVGGYRFEMGPLPVLFLGGAAAVHEWDAQGRLQPWGLEKGKLGEGMCDVIVWKEDRSPKNPGKYLTEWRLWVDADAVPRRHEERTELHGSTTVTILDYGKIERVEGKRPELFTFTPPQGAIERKPGEMLPAGAVARNFEFFQLSDRQELRLADFQDKILLLHVWSDTFENRPELLKLQRLQDDYAARGVAVVSVDTNCCLAYDLPLPQYYRDQKLRFPLAREPLFHHPRFVEEYGVTTYPCYFIITGGKVGANGAGLDDKAIREKFDVLAPKK